MNFKVLGDSDCPLIHVDLSDGGQVKMAVWLTLPMLKWKAK